MQCYKHSVKGVHLAQQISSDCLNLFEKIKPNKHFLKYLMTENKKPKTENVTKLNRASRMRLF